MINKKQIEVMAKKIMRHQQGLQDPQIMHPEREWTMGLVIFLVILLFCTFLSIYIYSQNKNFSLGEIDSNTNEVVVYRESLVKEALEKFSQRDTELKNLLGTVTPVVISEAEPVDIASPTESAATTSDQQPMPEAVSTE